MTNAELQAECMKSLEQFYRGEINDDLNPLHVFVGAMMTVFPMLTPNFDEVRRLVESVQKMRDADERPQD